MSTHTVVVQVQEDWQQDALQLSPMRRQEGGGVVMVGRLLEIPGQSPVLRLVPYVPNLDEALGREEPVGIRVQVDVARALYEALGRHFGDHQDPASRELVDVLKDVLGREAERVDAMVGHLTRPASA